MPSATTVRLSAWASSMTLRTMAVTQLVGGEVDGDGERVGRDDRPSRGEVRRRPVEDRAADGHDQPGVFGQRDEVGRVDDAAVGVLPADEGFDADGGPGGDVDQW